MNDSREKILGAVHRNQPQNVKHPGLDGDWINYPDPVSQLSEVLEFVGGHAVSVGSVGEINDDLENHAIYASASVICSNVAGVGRVTRDLAQVPDPHDLCDVDFAVIRGEFAVAENGAVWIDGNDLALRSVLFLCQHLAFVVPADQIIHNMAEAYHRLGTLDPGFGVFVSGPSKTADIEQSLVIGAHGARSLTVYLLKN